MGHLLGYARVSTTDQHPQLQVDALGRVGCYWVFSETASGARTDWPTLEQLLDQLRPGDTLVVWKLDRLGRSLRHLVDTVTGGPGDVPLWGVHGGRDRDHARGESGFGLSLPGAHPLTCGEHVFEEAMMAARCSFCGSTAGPFNKVEGLFTVLMCADCQAARGYGSGPYPVMTRAELRAGLDQLPTWALEQKAAANRQIIAVTRQRLAAGEEVPRMYQEPGLAWLERQAEVAEQLVAGRKRTPENDPGQ